jgi:ABC-type multidrug transport system fused ATPase/permease subunit
MLRTEIDLDAAMAQHVVTIPPPAPLQEEKSFHDTRWRKPAAIEFTNLRFATAGKQILNGVSGSARPGEVVAIMGPSGAGTHHDGDCVIEVLFELSPSISSCVISFN